MPPRTFAPIVMPFGPRPVVTLPPQEIARPPGVTPPLEPTLPPQARLPPEVFVPPGIRFPPIELASSTEVLRPDDMLHLRVAMTNMAHAPDDTWSPAKPDAPGLVTFYFPPQHIQERSFPEEPVADVHGRPRARVWLSLPSRLVIEVPQGATITFTTAGLLEALARFPPRLSASARGLPRVRSPMASLPADARPITAVESARLGLLVRRIGASSLVVSPDRIRRLRDGLPIDLTLDPRVAFTPRAPERPGDDETAIEAPWRLILSPSGDSRWTHRSAAPKPSPEGRVELWHTRLAAQKPDGSLDERPEASRVARAVWTRDFDATNTSDINADSLRHTDVPGPTPLDALTRARIVHLTSDQRLGGHAPAQVRRWMLSSLGAWLDLQAQWNTDPRSGIDLISWEHRATMGRDQRVRVEFRGWLWPFGHRASLVVLTERKLRPEAPDVAYLWKRNFIRLQERFRTYPAERDLTVERSKPLVSAELRTLVTPALELRPADESFPRPPETLEPEGPVALFAGGAPFRFRVSAVDRDDGLLDFEVPLVWVPQSWSTPLTPEKIAELRALYGLPEPLRTRYGITEAAPLPRYAQADREANLRGQRVALAPSSHDPARPGDSRYETAWMSFDGALGDDGRALPQLAQAGVAIEALRAITGQAGAVTVNLHPDYLALGLPKIPGDATSSNHAEVLLQLATSAKTSFSKATDRTGGFIAPEMNITALSRSLGLVSGDSAKLNEGGGTFDPSEFFKGLADGAKLFGVFPLTEIIPKGALDNAPRFVTQALDTVESIVSEMLRWKRLVEDLWRKVTATFEAIKAAATGVAQQIADALTDLDFGAAVEKLLALAWPSVQTPLADVVEGLAPGLGLRADLLGLSGFTFSAWGGFVEKVIDKAVDKLATVLTALVQRAVDWIAAQLDTVVAAVKARLAPLARLAMKLWSVWHQGEALVKQATALTATAVSAPSKLDVSITGVAGLVTSLAGALGGDFGAVLNSAFAQVADGIAQVRMEIETRVAQVSAFMQKLSDTVSSVLVPALKAYALAQELAKNLTVRYEWATPVGAFPVGAPLSEQVFVPYAMEGDALAPGAKPSQLRLKGELRGKEVGGRPAGLDIQASLDAFTLQLIAPYTFFALHFERLVFRALAGKKPEVDVGFKNIEFRGPLEFVETLRKVIPLDGFSDPPALSVSASGIEASFSMALPNLAVGIFSLQNISLSAGFSIPFLGKALSIRFGFCTRENPFQLTVSLLGGGGFFGLRINPGGVELLEAALEFGAALSLDFGVASGSVSVMVGVYFKLESGDATLTGYFRLRGEVDVLGLISASLELYMSLTYESATGKVIGYASLEIEVEVLFFSASVTVAVEKRFAGANGDPTFLDVMSPDPAAAFDPWRDYFEAFDAAA